MAVDEALVLYGRQLNGDINTIEQRAGYLGNLGSGRSAVELASWIAKISAGAGIIARPAMKREGNGTDPAARAIVTRNHLERPALSLPARSDEILASNRGTARRGPRDTSLSGTPRGHQGARHHDV